MNVSWIYSHVLYTGWASPPLLEVNLHIHCRKHVGAGHIRPQQRRNGKEEMDIDSHHHLQAREPAGGGDATMVQIGLRGDMGDDRVDALSVTENPGTR